MWEKEQPAVKRVKVCLYAFTAKRLCRDALPPFTNNSLVLASPSGRGSAAGSGEGVFYIYYPSFVGYRLHIRSAAAATLLSLRDISPNRGIYPEGKARITGKFFPVLRGKWRKVPKGGRPPPRRKVDLSVAKRRMRSHILKHDASSTANAVPLPRRGKALKYRQNSKNFYTPLYKCLTKLPAGNIIHT